jgi:hypothetical protein
MSRPGVEASQQDSHEGGIDVAPELTHVDLLWIKQRVDNRIRLGRIDQQHVIDCHPHVVSFSAGSVFAFVRWASNAYRTVLSRIDTLRAVAPGERYVTVPDVHPGGESLLQIAGWPRADKGLQAIEVCRSTGYRSRRRGARLVAAFSQSSVRRRPATHE